MTIRRPGLLLTVGWTIQQSPTDTNLLYAGIGEGALTTMGMPPDECLELTNNALCSYETLGMFGSVVCVLMDTTSRIICYSDGGHLPMLINRTRHRGLVRSEGVVVRCWVLCLARPTYR